MREFSLRLETAGEREVLIMDILYIEETGSVSEEDVKESERLKSEVYQDCVEWVKDFLSPEQLQHFEMLFNEVAAKYLFKERE